MTEDKYLEAQGGYMNEGYSAPTEPPPTYGKTVQTPQVPEQTSTAQPSSVHVLTAAPQVYKKNLCDAYILAIGLGFFGAHHFYLRRYGFGVLYLFTFGLFGVGYIVDWFRVPCLVKEANEEIQNPSKAPNKSLFDAYLLWFPGGLFGFHHFYLERYVWGVFYLCTLGVFGIGWIIDGFRMSWLVKSVNTKLKGSTIESRLKGIGEAYVLTMFPLTGLLGFQHYYLGRTIPGLYYTFTLGGCGCGWLMDWCRMPTLVKRENAKIRQPIIFERAYLDDAYMYLFPLGFLGLHHFYLGRHGWGVLYFFTFGMFGIGWLVDWVRLPCLVASYNEMMAARSIGNIKTVTGQISTVSSPAGGTVITVTNGQNVIQDPRYPGYPGYQAGFPPGIYPQPGPGVYPSAGQDSWATVTSSNVSDQPPSYTETVDASVDGENARNEQASAPPSFTKE